MTQVLSSNRTRFLKASASQNAEREERMPLTMAPRRPRPGVQGAGSPGGGVPAVAFEFEMRILAFYLDGKRSPGQLCIQWKGERFMAPFVAHQSTCSFETFYGLGAVGGGE